MRPGFLARSGIIALLISILSFPGCGGGGSSSESSPPPLQIHNYLFYHTSDYITETYGNLYAVDTANPIVSQSVAGDIIGPQTIFSASYDPVSGRFSNLKKGAVAYIKGGRIFRVDAAATSPASVQISNESSASTVCETYVIEDFAVFGNSLFLYDISPSGYCTVDRIRKAARLNSGQTTLPSVIPNGIISAIYNPSTYAINGIVAADNASKALYECDSAMNCRSISLFNTGVDGIERFFGSDLFAVIIDGNLRTYKPGSLSLSAIRHTFSNPTPELKNEGDGSIYFFDSDKLYRLDANGTVIQLYSSPETLSTDFFLADGAYIIVETDTTTWKSTIKAIPKNGMPAVDLASNDPSMDEWIELTAVSGRHIYYTRYDSSFFPTSGYILEDGTGIVESAGSYWAGATFGASVPASMLLESSAPQNIFRVEGCALDSYRLECVGGVVKVFEASTFGQEVSIGTLPGSIAWFFVGGVGPELLAEGSSATSIDIFYLNTGAAGSLKRLTSSLQDEFALKSMLPDINP